MFVRHEIYTALACFTVFLATHMLAYLAEVVTGRFPLHDEGPHAFATLALAWVASIGTVVAFTVITIYQLYVLTRRLMGHSR